MRFLKVGTSLIKTLSTVSIIVTGFGGFASQAAQAIEPSCDLDSSTTLIGCDFQGQDLSGRSLSDYVIVNSNFGGANLQSVNLQGVNLTANTFSNSTSMQNANLSQANLSGLDLSGISFNGSILNNSNLSGANLTGANLSNANLSDANLSSVNLTNATLSGTNISNTDFTNAEFSGVTSQNLANTPLLLPGNWRILNGYLLGPKANLAYANLSSQSLNNLDLSGADLSHATLNSTNLNGATLTSANLTSANLYFADLTNTNFTDADLSGVNLTGAYISGTNFSRAKLVNVQRLCHNEYICNYYQYGYGFWDDFVHRVGFTYANLSGVKSLNFPSTVKFWNIWSSSWDRYYCEYYGYNWYCHYSYISISLPSGWVNRNGVLLGKGVNLSGGSYQNWDFAGIDLSDVKFDNTQLSGASFAGSTLTNVDFSGKDLSNVNFGSANLTGANFSGAYLDGANFNNSTLTGANFSGTNLSSVSLSNVTSGQITGEVTGLPSGWRLVKGYLVGRTAQLSQADLSGADLSGLDLSSAYLYQANLRSSDLTGSKLYAANLNQADLFGAKLTNVSSGSISGPPSALPEAWHFVRGYLVGPTANLAYANLAGLDLSYWDLSGVNLTKASLWDSTFREVSFVGAKLNGANFDRSFLGSANLTDADLTSASLILTDLAYTNFTRANLTSITRYCQDYWGCWVSSYSRYQFTSSILTGVKSSNMNIFSSWGGNSVSMPAGWTFRNGTFFGPTADLSGLNLRSADLSNLNLASANLSEVDLSSANLTGTDLSGASLTGVVSRAVRGNPTLPQGWVLANGTLIGAGVQATNLNLSGFDLSGLNLAGIDLRNSNLTGANLTNTDLSGANLRNANLSGADLSGSNLNLADLGGVVFGDIIAQNIVGSPINVPNGWALQGGKFVGTIFLNKVSVSGDLQFGQQLTANVSSSPSNVEYVFAWYRDGMAIQGAVGRTYHIGIADLGRELSVQVSATKANFVSASATSDEVFVSNSLPALNNLNIQGSAAKDGQLALNFAGNVPFSSLLYQLSRDGGKSWINLAGPNYNIQFNDLGGNLNFRITQTAEGYLTQVTDFDSVPVDGSFVLPGFSQGAIDGANSGFPVQGNALVGSSLKVSKTIWPTGTRVTGFWWSTSGTSVGTKLTYKSRPQDIGAQLLYIEVGVSPTGTTKYRLSESIDVVPNQFDKSSKPTLVGSTIIGSKLKVSIGASWSSGAKYSYQWLSDGEIIPGASSLTYTITSDDIGSALSVRVCATKVTFADKCEDSLSTGVITYATIDISSKPTVKYASTKLGKQLSSTPGKWLRGVTFQFQWLRDGIEIYGATSSTYIVSNEDTGHMISVRVTGSKPGFLDLSRVSDSKLYK
jgi:uncharacterized protein YjbI with pentapeptide repeats